VAFVESRRRGEDLGATTIGMPMRGTVERLATPRALVEQLPAALQEDDFCTRMTSAFDEVLAPIFNVLDCFPSYLDPQLAPQDFVEWLASWVGVDIDETWTLERRRRLIQDAVALYRVRGTAAGLSAHVRLYAGASPEIRDSGGCTWSQSANSEFPGSAQPHLKVRLRLDDESAIRRSTVTRIIDANRPAHVPFEVEILVGDALIEGSEEKPFGEAAADAPGAIDLPGSERIELAPQGPAGEEEEEFEASPEGEEPSS
jgi:phage tail-like protein